MRRAALTLGGIALVILLAWGLRRWFALSLDLRDFPGPASGHILTMAGPRTFSGAGVDRHLTWAINLVGGDVLPAMRVVMMALGLVGVLGAMLGGWAVAGHLGGLAAGLFAAAWSQSLMLSLMVSYDTAGFAAGWLGLGLALAAARWGGDAPWLGDASPSEAPEPRRRGARLAREAAWVALLFVGAMLVVYGLGAKEVAHPLLPMLAAAPFFIRHGWVRRGVATAIVAAVGIWGLSWELGLGWVNPRAPRHIRRLPDLDPRGVVDGLRWYWDLIYVGPGWACNILLPITALAIVGAALPGPAWLGRLALLGVSGVALGLSWDLVADWLRIRYMAVPNLPLLLLAAAAVASLTRALGRLGPLRFIPLAAAFGLLVVDAVDYGRAWSELREPWTEIEPSTLPETPRWPLLRNGIEVGNAFGDFTVTGGIGMVDLVASSPPGGVGTIQLRDSRDSSITAAAALNHLPYTVLEVRRCCPDDRATPECAASVVQAFDEAGGRLLLAHTVEGDPRLNMPHLEGWRRLLIDAARERGELVEASRYWYTFTGSGSGGALPCRVEDGPSGPADAPRPMGPPLGEAP